MSRKSVITKEMHEAIGIDSEPKIHEVDKVAIIRFAEAIGDQNPLYWNEGIASKSRYEGIIAPPTFLRSLGAGRPKSGFKSPYADMLDGGSDWEYLGHPVRPGSRISVTDRIVELYEKNGRLGKMLFKIVETSYVDQTDMLIARQWNTTIYYQGSGNQE